MAAKIKYRITKRRGPEKVIIERETDSFVWIKGRRNAKATSYERYFDTIEQVKEYRIGLADTAIEKASTSLEEAIKDRAELLKEIESWDI